MGSIDADGMKVEQTGDPMRMVVELWRLPQAYEPAPDGYEWASLGEVSISLEGSRALALMCMTCAALVGIPEAHTAWHQSLRRGA